jgi:hypothetical protein
MTRFSSILLLACLAALLLGQLGCQPERQRGVQAVDVRPSFAVVASDYSSSSVALLDADGSVLAPDFLHSGSAPAGLVATLSGDVVLPTRSGEDGIVTLLDRFRTDVVTRVDPMRGRVVGQLRTQNPERADGSLGYSSNPQDYVFFDASTAWVTRFEPNMGVDRDDIDRGNDLLRIDPTGLRRMGRISLQPLNGRAPRVGLDGEPGEAVAVFARPSTMSRVGDRLVVGLARLSLAADAMGEGMVALVDPASGDVQGVPLEGMLNCAELAPVPDEPNAAVVSCGGFYRTPGREGAGLALLRLRDGMLQVEHLWRAVDHPDAPLAVGAVVPLGGSEVIAVAHGEGEQRDGSGELSGPPSRDRVYVADLETGERSLLFEARGRFVIGSGAYDADSGLLLIPDASIDDSARPVAGVRRFLRAADGGLEPLDVIEVDDVLPVRQVRAL